MDQQEDKRNPEQNLPGSLDQTEPSPVTGAPVCSNRESASCDCVEVLTGLRVQIVPPYAGSDKNASQAQKNEKKNESLVKKTKVCLESLTDVARWNVDIDSVRMEQFNMNRYTSRFDSYRDSIMMI